METKSSSLIDFSFQNVKFIFTRYWYIFILKVIVDCICTSVELLIPKLLETIVDDILDGKTYYEIIDEHLNYLVGLYSSSFIAAIFGLLVYQVWIVKEEYTIRLGLFSIFLKQPRAFHDTIETSEYNVRGSEVSLFFDLFVIVSSTLKGIFTLVLSMYNIFNYHYTIVLLLLAYVPFDVMIRLLIANPISKQYKKIQNDQVRLETNGIHTMERRDFIVYNGLINYEKQYMHLLLSKLKDRIVKLTIWIQSCNLFLTCLDHATKVVCWIYLIWLVAEKDEITIGELFAIQLYLPMISASFSILTNVITEVITWKAKVAKVADYYQRRDPAMTKNIDLLSFEIKQAFQFRYPNSINTIMIPKMSIFKGQKVLITGENGSGKTTFVRLLKKDYETSGTIWINNHFNVDEIDLNCFVNTQHGWYPERTIYENMLLNNKDDPVMINSLKNYLHYFNINHINIHSKQTLSGGQTQTCLLIRSLLSYQNFIILDEPTSAFDTAKSELFFTKQMHEMYVDKTLIIIAHIDEKYHDQFDQVVCF